MSRIFVIPDVHLKPWMFKKASALVAKGTYDAVVMLGDLVDDWYQEDNIDLYNATFDSAIAFVKRHPDTFWCIGNHDISYVWNEPESGFSINVKDTVVRRFNELKNTLPSENSAFIFRFDNTLFSHGGLTERFVFGYFGREDTPGIDDIIGRINRMGSYELWYDDSPIWARPQNGRMILYPENMFQVVGHTPVRTALEEGNLLTLDNFSTYRDGRPIGDERFVWIDTVEKTWAFVEE